MKNQDNLNEKSREKSMDINEYTSYGKAIKDNTLPVYLMYYMSQNNRNLYIPPNVFSAPETPRSSMLLPHQIRRRKAAKLARKAKRRNRKK